MLDWGALLLTETARVNEAHGGLGYMLFAFAMTAGRFTGDALVAKAGRYPVLFWSGIAAAIGYAVILEVPSNVMSLSGFLLVGLGSSNIVPVL